VAILVARNVKRGNGDSYGEVWRSLRLAGVWSQAVGFVLVRLAGRYHHEDVFAKNLHLKHFF
jgi:hypothetical protein